MAKKYFFIFYAITMITFGAKLLTNPTKFFLKTDTIEEKTHIKNIFAMTEKLLKSKPIDRFTHNDTVELVRLNNRHKGSYIIKYKANGENTCDIRITHNDIKKSLYLKGIFENIVNITGLERGILKKMPLFSTYEQIRNKVFELSQKEIDVFNRLGL